MNRHQSVYIFAFSVMMIGTISSHATELITKRQALAQMQEQGFKYKQAGLVMDDAEAKMVLASAAKYPVVTAEAREGLVKVGNLPQYPQVVITNETIPLTQIGVQAAYKLYDRSAWDKIEASKQNFEMNKTLREKLRDDLAFLMVVQYISAQKYKKELEQLKLLEESHQKILKYAQAKSRSGAGLPVEVARAEDLLLLDEVKMARARANYTKYRHELNILIGNTSFENEKDVPPLQAITKTIKNADQIHQRALNNRNDLKAALQGVEAAEWLKKSAVSEYKPKISLVAEAGFFGTKAWDTSTFGPAWAAGVQVTIPIYETKLINGKKMEQEATLRKAKYQVEELKLEIQAQSREVIEQMHAAETAVTASKQHLAVAAKYLNLTEKRYFECMGNGLELVSARDSYTEAMNQNLESEYLYEMAVINYHRAQNTLQDYLSEGD